MYKKTLQTLPSLLLVPTIDNKTEETQVKSPLDFVLAEFSEEVPFCSQARGFFKVLHSRDALYVRASYCMEV